MTPHRILTAVLFIAVVFLYVLHFKKPADENPGTAAAGPALPIPTNIVYVNSDSLLDNYAFYKNNKEAFEKKEAQIKSQLQVENEHLQKDAAEYQEKAATMTENERSKKEEDL